MKTNLSLVLLVLVVVHFNRVGIAQWCIVNKTDKTIQCNYETEGECEGYRAKGEFCHTNPFYVAPAKPEVKVLKDGLREPNHVAPK